MPVPSGDLLAAPGYSWMSQMATQGLKMMQAGIKNGTQITHLDTIIIISMATKVGTGGRGGALKYYMDRTSYIFGNTAHTWTVLSM